MTSKNQPTLGDVLYFIEHVRHDYAGEQVEIKVEALYVLEAEIERLTRERDMLSRMQKQMAGVSAERGLKLERLRAALERIAKPPQAGAYPAIAQQFIDIARKALRATDETTAVPTAPLVATPEGDTRKRELKCLHKRLEDRTFGFCLDCGEIIPYTGG